VLRLLAQALLESNRSAGPSVRCERRKPPFVRGKSASGSWSRSGVLDACRGAVRRERRATSGVLQAPRAGAELASALAVSLYRLRRAARQTEAPGARSVPVVVSTATPLDSWVVATGRRRTELTPASYAAEQPRFMGRQSNTEPECYALRFDFIGAPATWSSSYPRASQQDHNRTEYREPGRHPWARCPLHLRCAHAEICRYLRARGSAL
jgi:hypothetical protein